MKQPLRKEMFAPMRYLDTELARIQKEGGYVNSKAQHYYEALFKIRELQNSGEIPPDALYKSLSPRYKGLKTVEYGYYTANIHYYLFESCSEFEVSSEYKRTLNERILNFLEIADDDALASHSWFASNFPSNYLRFLSIQYGQRIARPNDTDQDHAFLEGFIERFGDDADKEIARRILALSERI